MKIIIANDYEDMSRKAANYLSAQVIMKPDAVLGLATGETPIGTYKQLVEWYNKGDIDFSQTSTINLDEYKGLTGDHKQSYRYFMDTNLFDLINIKKSNTYLPNGMAEDEEAECARYEGIMKQLGNLSIVCAQCTDVLMQIYGGQMSVHVGEGPERTSLFAAWDDDEVIQRIIHELNFGRYAIKEKRNSKENVA